jgi:branched-subunit amino acid transport protein
MPEKRSKYDTDPLDPDFARRARESRGRADAPDETVPLPPASVTEEQTRRFDEQLTDSYPSVFVPPAYKPPHAPEPQPFGGQPLTSFGAGAHQPPAPTVPPPPGPSSQYQPPYGRPGGAPSSRPVTRLGLPENVANVLPYIPFYIGLVAAVIELAVVPRHETRTRFHAAQGLALQLAIVAGSVLFQMLRFATGSGFGRVVFGVAALVFLVYSAVRVWQGKPHHLAPLEEPARWLDEKIPPMK